MQQYANLVYGSYFRKIYVNNLENLPRNEPVILASNHQNALIDALAFVYSARCQPVFLARADIFKGRLLKHFLNFLNIMPIYRMRDGAASLKKNEEIFEKTLSVLKNKYNPLLLFPEGAHGDKRRLRPLKKGIFRIAFMAQDYFKNRQVVKIVPVGLDYGDYQKFRSTLFINYGKPIEVSDYYSLYTENNIEAVNKLRERLAREISNLMIDIQTEEYYDLYQNLRIIYNSELRKRLNITGKSLHDKFTADKKMISVLDEYKDRNPKEIKSLDKKVSEYMDGLNKFNLRDWVLQKDFYPLIIRCLEALLLMTLLPVHILGMVNNYVPYKIPAILTRKIKDPQFHSSFKLVMALVFFPAYYIILVVAGLILINPLWIKLAYFFTIPLTGLFAFKYYIRLKKLRAKFRYSSLVRRKNSDIRQLRMLRRDITDSMNKIIEKGIGR